MKKLAAIAAALALLTTACGGGQSMEDEFVPVSQPPQTILRYGISNSWDALMPYNSVSGSNYARIVYDKLYDRLAFVHADGRLSPRGAATWESADGGSAILFHLDPSAAFHDGTPVTAEHWAQTLRLVTDPACPVLGRATFACLTGTDDTGAAQSAQALGVVALDEHTLKLTFKLPTSPEEFLLDKNREIYVLPTHLLEGVPPEDVLSMDLWRAPIGSGPCKFVEELPGSQLVLAANERYQLGAPGFDQLVIAVMDKANLLTALIAGDLDYYAFGGSVSADDAVVARQNGLEVVQGNAANTFFELMLNNTRIDDVRIRRAIALALDKPLLCEQATKGLGAVTDTSMNPDGPYARALPPAERDVAQAQALLAEAACDGRVYRLACTSNRAGMAALMQQNLTQVGIQIEIETVDSATMFAGMADGSYDMGIASHTPGLLPLWFVESRFAENNNIFHVPDLGVYTTYLARIKSAPAQQRETLLWEFDDFLVQECPFIPLWFGTALHVQSPTVTGIDYGAASFSNDNVWAWQKAAG